MKDAKIDSIEMELKAAHKLLDEKVDKLQHLNYQIDNIIESLKSLDKDLEYIGTMVKKIEEEGVITK